MRSLTTSAIAAWSVLGLIGCSSSSNRLASMCVFTSTKAGVDSVCEAIPRDAGILSGSSCTINLPSGSNPATHSGTAMESCPFPIVQTDQ